MNHKLLKSLNSIFGWALSAYIETGDEAGINALAPMIAADSMALAVQQGEVSPDAGADALADALGYEPGPIFGSINTQPPPAAADPIELTDVPAPAPYSTDAQVSLGSGMGYMAPGAAARWAAAPYTGDQSVPTAFHGLTVDAVRATARASAAGGGWAAPVEAA